jgi:hypothetical protein
MSKLLTVVLKIWLKFAIAGLPANLLIVKKLTGNVNGRSAYFDFNSSTTSARS